MMIHLFTEAYVTDYFLAWSSNFLRPRWWSGSYSSQVDYQESHKIKYGKCLQESFKGNTSKLRAQTKLALCRNFPLR